MNNAQQSSIWRRHRRALWCACAGAAAAHMPPGAHGQSGSDISPFTEEALARGVAYIVTHGNADQGYGTGAGMADLDNDGHPDIVITGRSDGVVGVFHNDGTGHFTDVSASSGIPTNSGAAGVSIADYDGDGFLDIYFSDWYGANVLARNAGGLTFLDVTDIAGVGDIGIGTGTAWADINGDGWLDLYLANRTGNFGGNSTTPNRLYLNNGDGTFDEVAEQYGVDDSMPTFQPIFFDMNKNGLPDLYLSTDKGYFDGIHNRLFENVGGEFIEITESSGTAANIDSMGVAVGDFSGNGYPDLYCTNTMQGNKLFINQGDGTFTEEAAAAGVTVNNIGWGTLFFDFDNSGRQDLFVCNSMSTNRLYLNTGSWPCQHVSNYAGLTHAAPSYVVAAADIDSDGDIDLLVQNFSQRVRLYINHEGEKRNWVKFNVIGTGPNRFAVGARIEVCADEHWQMREIHAGISYKSQNEYTQHFGLGQRTILDEIVVAWPGGASRTLTGYAANHTWTLYPVEMLGDATRSGMVDVDDFLVFAACFNSSGTGESSPVIPGCEMMDFDGNGVIDLLDFDAFVNVYSGLIGDCNGSGQIDLLDILLGESDDANGNAVPDDCEGATPDIDGNGNVNVADLLALLGAWGPCRTCAPANCPADLNGDCTVNVVDLLILLGAWG